MIWGRQTGNGPVRGIPLPSGSPTWGSGWKAAVKEHFLHTGRIESQSSNMAYRGCYLDLDPTYRDAYGTPLLRMTLNWQDNDMRDVRILRAKAVADRQGDGCEIHVWPRAEAGRQLGHARLSEHPHQRRHGDGRGSQDQRRQQVPAKLGRAKLFVLGANVFAHGIGYNPTGLVGGLAYWAAANIRSTYLKDPGPMVRL